MVFAETKGKVGCRSCGKTWLGVKIVATTRGLRRRWGRFVALKGSATTRKKDIKRKLRGSF